MEAHIIYLPKSKHSVDLANRALKNLKETLDIDGRLFEGTDRYSVWQEYIDYHLKLKINSFGVGKIDSEIATFLSHYKLWKKCLDNSKKFLILENDSLFTENVNIDTLLNFNGDLLNLGLPSWKNNMIKDKNQNPAISWLDKKDGIFNRKEKNNYTDCLYGAHCYVLNPSGAKKLIDNIDNGIEPADIYLNMDRVDISDLLPHPATAFNDKSFIQRYDEVSHDKKDVWDY